MGASTALFKTVSPSAAISGLGALGADVTPDDPTVALKTADGRVYRASFSNMLRSAGSLVDGAGTVTVSDSVLVANGGVSPNKAGAGSVFAFATGVPQTDPFYKVWGHILPGESPNWANGMHLAWCVCSTNATNTVSSASTTQPAQIAMTTSTLDAVVGTMTRTALINLTRDWSFVWWGRIQAAAPNHRAFVGVFTGLQGDVVAADDPAVPAIGFQFSSARGDTSWRLIASDGLVTNSVGLVPLADFSDTAYHQFRLDYTKVDGTVRGYINGDFAGSVISPVAPSAAYDSRFALLAKALAATSTSIRVFRVVCWNEVPDSYKL